MNQHIERRVRRGWPFSAVSAFLFVGALTLGAQSSPAPASSEWRSYAGDLRNHHYSPLGQITAENFSSLEVAWRFKTDSLGPRPEYKLEGTPLMVNGVLYTTAGTRRSVVALDAATGELRWVHAELEGGTPRTHNNTKGMVRGFDVRTGKRLWTFNTIPRPGEFGNDTWLNESWAVNGNVGVWNQIAVDEDLGLAYLPVETPSSDFYGGLRPGNNLFAESIVAIDYRTGVRRWHFQLVHHPIWNMDIAAAPILVDLTVGGQGVTLENLIDFTPALHAEALTIAARYKLGPIFTPPPVSKREGPIGGFRSSGGTNWPGGSFDPETHIAYVPSFTAMPVLGLLPPPNKEFSDLPYVSGNALTGVRYISGPGENVGADARAAPSGRGGAPLSSTGDSATNANARPQGLPLLKPPYGRITAINLDRGEIVWQVPHGETPDSVRNHPALTGLTIPRTGQSGAVGALVTKTLVIAGDPLATTGANRPRGAMLHAYDKSSGKEVGAVYMPAPQSGTPMTYALNGRQYIVVPISGGSYSGEYLAFALPARTFSQTVVPEPNEGHIIGSGITRVSKWSRGR